MNAGVMFSTLETTTMRSWFLAGGLLLVGIAISSPAQAQNYPWCAYYGWSGFTYNCGFVSFAQCMATAAGTGATCRPNPHYQAPPRHRLKKKRR